MIIFAGCLFFMSLLLTTAYLPPIAYMAKAMHSDDLCIEAWETYTKQTCRNHCNIYSPNGRQTLTVPVIRVNGNHTLTRDIKISYSLPWQKVHWRSIETAYNNSPFFLYYQDFIVPFFEKRNDFLLDLNLQLLETLLKSVKASIHVGISNAFTPLDPADDREWLISKKCDLTTPEYIQVFSGKSGFIPNLSIIDLIFNMGPESYFYLSNIA